MSFPAREKIRMRRKASATALSATAFFVSGQKLVEYIGEGAIKVITRMMGLTLAVIGIRMMIEGIYGAIHMFK